ncbi:BrnT family toxin [Acidithiobacillus sp. 'AMD consortium']|uniref:BrnT family toxin n=2 Tax=Acidithiobacillus ferridurans TaxID=1232575 RepID=A0A8X8K7L4_ACIFI|nr:BrnT family toxin [Acidithiobacillus ferridurans]MBU2721926.1 BrnT family toxin [Acidithiobacillus ferridurans]MBU2727848.1 BrnT family toxin [Acidithiobacillus ferridurans]QFG79989.1 BrnT family toxin [Acidithiobacillus sp. 'AMD consortium']
MDRHFLCYYTKSSGQRPDFRDADWLPESRYRLDVPVVWNSEMRLRSLAYVFELFAVLSLAHAERGEESRLISFRKAGAEGREWYHEWLENDFTD